MCWDSRDRRELSKEAQWLLLQTIKLWWLTTVLNSHYKSSNTLFWPPWALNTRGAQIHMQAGNHPHTVNLKPEVPTVLGLERCQLLKAVVASCRTGVGSQRLHGGSQLSVTLVPGDTIASFWPEQVRCIHTGKTSIHIEWAEHKWYYCRDVWAHGRDCPTELLDIFLLLGSFSSQC